MSTIISTVERQPCPHDSMIGWEKMLHIERCVVIDGEWWMIKFIEDQETDNDCPYTHSHTKHWCGYEGCRES